MSPFSRKNALYSFRRQARSSSLRFKVPSVLSAAERSSASPTQEAESCAIVSYTARALPPVKHPSPLRFTMSSLIFMTEPSLDSTGFSFCKKRAKVVTSLKKVPPLFLSTARSASKVSLSSQNM